MTPERLAELDAIVAKATAGLFEASYGEVWQPDGRRVAECDNDEDAAAIVALHNAYPDLSALIDAQAETIAGLREALMKIKTADTRTEYWPYLNYTEDREYHVKTHLLGPCAKIATAALKGAA